MLIFVVIAMLSLKIIKKMCFMHMHVYNTAHLPHSWVCPSQFSLFAEL